MSTVRRTLARNLPIGIHKACAHRGWRAEPLNTFHSPAILTFLTHLSVGHSSNSKWLKLSSYFEALQKFYHLYFDILALKLVSLIDRLEQNL